MNTITSTIFFFEIARRAAAIHWLIPSIAISLLAGGLLLGGCSPAMTRPEVDRQKLLKLRSASDAELVASGERIIIRLLQRTKTEYDRRAAAGQPPPVIDILIVSGGGDWGAFGAGFLKGWLKVPAQHPLAKPEFDAVTGVSTGALIAPFAFLGDEQSTIFPSPRCLDSSAKCAATSPWIWFGVLRARAPMAGLSRSTQPIWTMVLHGCSTWGRKPNEPSTRTISIAFTASCSLRRAFPAPFRFA
jgi:Patatin-like phospholipase